MCTFDLIDEDEESIEKSVTCWTALANRGGLTIATDTAFELFQVLENVCRQHLSVNQLAVNQKINSNEIITTLLGMDDVVLLWTEMTFKHINDEVDAEALTSHMLLRKIVEKYVSIHTHSFGKGLIERYKPSLGNRIQDCQKINHFELDCNHVYDGIRILY